MKLRSYAMIIVGSGLGAVSLAGAAGTTGAVFLRFSPDAHTSALGGCQAVPLEAPSAIFGNPGALGFVRTTAMSFSYTQWLQGVDFGGVALVFPAGKLGMGVGARYLNYGEIAGYDVNANSSGNFTAADFCVLWGGGFEAGKRLSIGTSLKFISQKIESETASAAAMDAGMMYHFFPAVPMQIGVTLEHLALTQPKFVQQPYSLPTTLRLGATWEPIKEYLLLVLETYRIFREDYYLSSGAEIRIRDGDQRLALRGGYLAGPEGFGSGWSVGAGFLWGGYGVDYAFKGFGPLGYTHTFSMLLFL